MFFEYVDVAKSMDQYNENKTTEQIFISEHDNEIYFNGPINYISMSNLNKELLKLESKIMKESINEHDMTKKKH